MTPWEYANTCKCNAPDCGTCEFRAALKRGYEEEAKARLRDLDKPLWVDRARLERAYKLVRKLGWVKDDD
jgi:hypothetical protein